MSAHEQRPQANLRRALTITLLLGLYGMVGCFEWSEDPQGHLHSVGLPGIPVWQSQATPAPLNPTDLGMSADEAAKMSGPILVEPPDSTSRMWRYRYYAKGQNRCEVDLQKLLEERAQLGIGGADPYCSEHPPVPSASVNPLPAGP
ncbi:MAG TPA: hypothetical protein VKS22_01025 [Candidatus Binataceae bacterium]|nr:hypothetical protein [Candidatus Binataceae bacterium]